MTHVCVRSMMRRTAARPGVRRRSAPLHNSKKISPAAGHLALFTTENFLLHILGAPPRGPGRPDDATRDGAGTAAARRVSGHPARAAEPQALQLHTLPGSSRVLLSDRYYDVRSPSAAVLCTHSSHCLILLPQWYAATHRQAPARQPEASSQSDQVELIKLHDRRVAEQRNASLQERHTPRLASW